jgi:hypothetical protein
VKNSSSTELRLGKLFHTYILEPHKVDRFHFCSAKTAASKEYKDAIEMHGIDNVYTGDDQDKVNRLVDAFHRNEQAKGLVSGGEYEVPAIGEVFGLPFRAKADVLKYSDMFPDSIYPELVVDLKTTSGGVKNFKHSAYKYGYDVQVYIYCELFKVTYDKFRFLVIDKGTLDLAIFDVSEEFYLSGKERTYQGVETYLEWRDRDVNDYILNGTL